MRVCQALPLVSILPGAEERNNREIFFWKIRASWGQGRRLGGGGGRGACVLDPSVLKACRVTEGKTLLFTGTCEMRS